MGQAAQHQPEDCREVEEAHGDSVSADRLEEFSLNDFHVEEEAVITAFCRHRLLLLRDDCLYAVQAPFLYLTRSSLHCRLQRDGAAAPQPRLFSSPDRSVRPAVLGNPKPRRRSAKLSTVTLRTHQEAKRHCSLSFLINRTERPRPATTRKGKMTRRAREGVRQVT